MNNENNNKITITYEEAHSVIQGMNMINNFLFDAIMEDMDRAKKVAEIIISAVLGYEVIVDGVESQKVFGGSDKGNHGIRLDAYVGKVTRTNAANAKTMNCDIEMEDRDADRMDLPKRNRFYSSIVDSKMLKEGMDYRSLTDYLSIMVLSYDPFLAGDMYYEAKTILTSHPEIKYDDGRVSIFLYAGGKCNLTGDNSRGKTIEELVKYIVKGEVSPNPDGFITELKGIVDNVKKNAEVTRFYMQKWEREMVHDRELTEKVTAEVTKEVTDAVTKKVTAEVTKKVTDEVTAEVTQKVTNEVTENNTIKYINKMRKHGISDEEIRKDIMEDGTYADAEIDALFEKADEVIKAPV